MAATGGTDLELSKLRIDRGAPVRAPARRRRRPVRLVAPLLILLVLAAPVWWWWGDLREMVESRRAPEVRTGTALLVSPGKINEATTASGYVVARVRAALAAEVSGRLVELHVDVGSRVAKGALIARIDPGTWVHGVEETVATVARRKAEAAAADVQVDAARRAATRIDRALEEGRAAVPEVEVELREAERVLAVEERLAASGSAMEDVVKKARNEVARLRAVLDRRRAAVLTLEADRGSADAQVRVAEALSLARAREVAEAEAREAASRVNLRNTEIRAPFSGVILRKEAEVGEMVVPALAGGSTSRGAVVTMADFNTLEMEVDVFERDIGLVNEGSPAEVELHALGGTRFPARVRQIVPTAERSKGTIQVKVAFEPGAEGAIDPRIRPEMGGKAVFLKAKAAPGAMPEIRAPQAAVVSREGRKGVYVVEADRARFRPVETGDQRGDAVVIATGLQGGELVVLDPPATVQDGTRVRRADPAR